MCCIFTCCGWMIDLIQRAWTFTMSCIIMSAVGGVMVTSSMSGIALGYNYSLAEYIDLKETNVSVYLKRGVFDDEIADDMEWRRAGHLPIQGHIKDENLRTGAFEDDESTTLRSGRRLDDSVFEADDLNKYEGSLMKLTAKPLYQDTPRAAATDDLEMANTLSRFTLEPLDQMKAIQSLIDSRRAMGTGGTTFSPLATYEPAAPILPYLPSNNNPNIPMHPEVHHRRMMDPGHVTVSPLNPARMAVPDPAMLESKVNWLGPKLPGIYVQSTLPEFFIKSPTYPPAITVAPATVRPTVQETNGRRYDGSVAFPYPFTPQKPTATPPSPTRPGGRDEMEKQPDFYNEKILAEGNELSKNEIINRPPKLGMKSPEEEYEDEIKGLPVRKRRSFDTPVGKETNRNIIHPVVKENPKSIGASILSMVKNMFTNAIGTSNVETNTTTYKSQSVVEDTKNSQIGIEATEESSDKHPIYTKDKRESDKVKSISEQNSEKIPTTLQDYLFTTIKTREATLAKETTSQTDIESSTAEKIKIKTIRRSFENKIVSSKYLPNNLVNRLTKAPVREETNRNIVHPVVKENSKSIGASILSMVKYIFENAIRTSYVENNTTIDNNKSTVEELKNSQIGIKVSDEANDKHLTNTRDKRESDATVTEVKSIPEQNSEKKPTTTLLDHLVTAMKTKKTTLAEETTSKTDIETSTAKKIKIKTIRRSFESKIVSSKYVQNNLARRLKKTQPFSNQEILDSISVGLNEAGLLRNPLSSPLVKLLQATLTA